MWNPIDDAWGLVEGAAGWVGDRIGDVAGTIDVSGGTTVGPVSVAGSHKTGSGTTYRITNRPANDSTGRGFTTDSGVSYEAVDATGPKAPAWLVPGLVVVVLLVLMR